MNKFDGKKLVKNIGYFLIIGTLVLSYFSPSVINYFIPKVKTVEPIYNALLDKSVKITGITKPREVLAIEVNNYIVIDRYMQKSGDHLKKGETLAYVKVINADEGVSKIALAENKIEMTQKEIQALRGKIDKIINNDLEQLTEQIERTKNNNANNEVLFQSGAIAESALDAGEIALDNLYVKQAGFEEQLKGYQLNIEKLQQNRKVLEGTLEGERLAVDENFYIEDGALKAMYPGIIIDVDESKEIIAPNESFGSFAKVEGYDDMFFEAQIPLDKSLEIQVNDELVFVNQYTDKEFIVKIESKSYIVENDQIRIKGAFQGKLRYPILFEEMTGDASRHLTGGQKAKWSYPTLVSKMALRPNGGVLEKGSSATVFYVEEKEGILGNEIYATALPVRIEAVGDFFVAVGGVDHSEEYQLIDNLDHNIVDGQRIIVQEN